MDLSSLQILLTSTVFIVSTFIWLHSRSSKSKRNMSNIPGRMGWPLIGETLSFISDFFSPSGIYSFISKRQKIYGNVFKTSVLGRFVVFMTGREASRLLLSGKDGKVSLNLFYTGKQVLGPTSLLTTTGEEHKHLRRLIAEPLSVDALKKYFRFIDNLAIETLDGWSGRTVFVFEEVSTFTLKVIGNMIMSLEPTGEEREKFRANFKIMSSAFASMPFKLPGSAFYRGMQARERIHLMLDSIISKRREGKDFHDDFLQTLVRKHRTESTGQDHKDLNKLSDSQLKDNIITLLVAGHDTTAASLTWLIKFIGENPAVLQNLREEHIGIQERRNGGSLTWSEVNTMPYTTKVISETLRRATILPWFSRKAAQDFNIDGYEIKKGWSVNLDVVSIHHDPNVFPNPEKFDPSRFDEPMRPLSYLGFGSGQRMCPGSNLAKLEICVFIHHLICRYKWRPIHEDNNSVKPTLVRMPKNNYPVIVEPL